MLALNKHLLEREKAHINEALQTLVLTLPTSLQAVAKHVLNAGGKRLRPLLMVHFAALFGRSDAVVYDIAAAIEVFHVATLLHDDVIDHADLRRGVPCAHKIFGVNTAILVGDALLAAGSRAVALQNMSALSLCVADAIVQTAHGEVLEIEAQGTISPDLTNYFSIITGKTAWMIQAACELGVLIAGGSDVATKAARDFGLHLGLAFQIVDDVLDFSPAEITGKPAGGDLREGKYTPPIHLYVQSLSPSARTAFAEAFAARSFTDEELLVLVDAINAGDFLEESRTLADTYLQTAFAALTALHSCGADAKHLDIIKEVLTHIGKRTR